MTRDEIEATIRDLYARRLNNDAAQVTGQFAADARFALSGDPAASRVACSVDGHENLCSLMANLVETWRWHDVKFHSIIIDGNRAAVNYKLTVTHVPSGQTVETDIVDVMTFSGDKIAEFTQYVDTAMAGKLCEIG
jgi:ketosteroid isomerase-like protein